MFIIALLLYPLALLAPAPSQYEVPEQTDEERQEAGVNMMWMAMGLTDVIFEVDEIRYSKPSVNK